MRIRRKIEGLKVDISGRVIGINHIGGDGLRVELKEALRGRYNIKGFVEGTVGCVTETYSRPEMALEIYFIK